VLLTGQAGAVNANNLLHIRSITFSQIEIKAAPFRVNSPQRLAIFIKDNYIRRNLPSEAGVVNPDPGLENRNYS
jgi:hypothetical protein